MLLNYLKLSLRLLARNPFFTGINVIGLAIGFASFYALWEYAITELRSDQYHKDYDRIARIGVNWQWTDDGGKTWGNLIGGFSFPSLLPRVSEDYPEVQSTLRILILVTIMFLTISSVLWKAAKNNPVESLKYE
jgi:putative ABC transport system permease protein